MKLKNIFVIGALTLVSAGCDNTSPDEKLMTYLDKGNRPGEMDVDCETMVCRVVVDAEMIESSFSSGYDALLKVKEYNLKNPESPTLRTYIQAVNLENRKNYNSPPIFANYPIPVSKEDPYVKIAARQIIEHINRTRKPEDSLPQTDLTP